MIFPGGGSSGGGDRRRRIAVVAFTLVLLGLLLVLQVFFDITINPLQSSSPSSGIKRNRNDKPEVVRGNGPAVTQAQDTSSSSSSEDTTVTKSTIYEYDNDEETKEQETAQAGSSYDVAASTENHSDDTTSERISDSGDDEKEESFQLFDNSTAAAALLPQPLAGEKDYTVSKKKPVDVYDPRETTKVIQWYVGGFAKSGTSFLLHDVFWKGNGTFTGRNHEIKELKKGKVGAFLSHFEGHYPRTEHFEPTKHVKKDGDEDQDEDHPMAGSTLVQNGFKNPHGITYTNNVIYQHRYIPHAKQIFTVRHPVNAFQSHFNFKLQKTRYTDPNFYYHGHIPDPADFIGYGLGLCDHPEQFPDGCLDFDKYPCSMNNTKDCSGRTAVHLYLSRLGYTPMTSPEERALLQNSDLTIYNFSETTTMHLNELSQLFFNNVTRVNGVIESMENFLGLAEGGLPRIDMEREKDEYIPTNDTERKGVKDDKEKQSHILEICGDHYSKLREHLVEIGKNASEWIEHYLLKSDRVYVYDREDFLKRIRKWAVDPCLAKKGS